MASPTANIRAASDSGRGLVSRKRLLELGVSSSAIARRVWSGELVVVVPGVYRPAAREATAELRVRAVMLRLGAHAVLSGRHAAWWHRLIAEPGSSVEIRVVMPAQGWCPRWPGLMVERRRLPSVDQERRRGVAVTTRARTVLDCADESDAEAIRDAALQRGTTTASLIGALDRMPSAPGVPAARALIEPVVDGWGVEAGTRTPEGTATSWRR